MWVFGSDSYQITWHQCYLQEKFAMSFFFFNNSDSRQFLKCYWQTNFEKIYLKEGCSWHKHRNSWKACGSLHIWDLSNAIVIKMFHMAHPVCQNIHSSGFALHFLITDQKGKTPANMSMKESNTLPFTIIVRSLVLFRISWRI